MRIVGGLCRIVGGLCRIVGKVPVVHDATGFCQQAPAPTSLSGRSPLKTNWFSGRVSPRTALMSATDRKHRSPNVTVERFSRSASKIPFRVASYTSIMEAHEHSKLQQKYTALLFWEVITPERIQGRSQYFVPLAPALSPHWAQRLA